MGTEHVKASLRRIRKHRGMTCEAISKAAGASPSYWYQYERGARRPSLTFIARMRHTIDLADQEILDIVRAIEKDDHEDPPAGGQPEGFRLYYP